MSVEDVVQQWLQGILAYLPNLFGGLILALIGLAGGWLAKRVVIQLASVLRLGRQFRRFRWGRDLEKADVRFSLYGLLGDITFLIVFLVFLNAAFNVMNLAVLSRLSERIVLVFPRLAISLVIVGGGWLISRWVSSAIRQALRRQNVPRSLLIADYIRAMIFFFAAMSVAELNIARDVVVIGFTVASIVLGAVTVVLVVVGGRGFFEQLFEGIEDDEPR
jgi:hypothetical protein